MSTKPDFHSSLFPQPDPAPEPEPTPDPTPPAIDDNVINLAKQAGKAEALEALQQQEAAQRAEHAARMKAIEQEKAAAAPPADNPHDLDSDEPEERKRAISWAIEQGVQQGISAYNEKIVAPTSAALQEQNLHLQRKLADTEKEKILSAGIFQQHPFLRDEFEQTYATLGPAYQASPEALEHVRRNVIGANYDRIEEERAKAAASGRAAVGGASEMSGGFPPPNAAATTRVPDKISFYDGNQNIPVDLESYAKAFGFASKEAAYKALLERNPRLKSSD